MADSNARDKMIAALEKPFEAAALKRHPQISGLTYIEGHTVIHRLNTATNNTWDLRIVSQDIRPFGKTGKGAERLLITALVELTIPGLGSRQHMGVQVVNAENGGEDMWKGAITDAVKKAATFFGVGLDQYGPDYESGELESRPQQATQRPPRPELPATMQTPPADYDRITTGQIEIAARHAREAGLTDAEIERIVKSKGRNTVSEFTKDEGASFIAFLSDKTKTAAWISKHRTQGSK